MRKHMKGEEEGDVEGQAKAATPSSFSATPTLDAAEAAAFAACPGGNLPWRTTPQPQKYSPNINYYGTNPARCSDTERWSGNTSYLTNWGNRAKTVREWCMFEKWKMNAQRLRPKTTLLHSAHAISRVYVAVDLLRSPGVTVEAAAEETNGEDQEADDHPMQLCET
eukprot:6152565-Amphidinium_carterae.1